MSRTRFPNVGCLHIAECVESFVQILQFLSCGQYEKQPKVDALLKDAESIMSNLDDSLRICASRIARAMYAIRNKRNIAHKSRVDLNICDLRLLHSCAQWILSEIIRQAKGISMVEASPIIEEIESPIGPIVEDIEGKRLVLGKLPIKDEVLVYLLSVYPKVLRANEITKIMDRRRPESFRKVLRNLWKQKMIQNVNKGYMLTSIGLNQANLINKAHSIAN